MSQTNRTVIGNSHCIEKKSVHTGSKQRKTSSTVAGRINTPACLPGQPLTDLSGKLVFFVMQSDPTYSNSEGFQKRDRLPCVCREGNQVSRSSEISIPSSSEVSGQNFLGLQDSNNVSSILITKR